MDAEVAARAVTSHLLDEGFSGQALHKWFTYQIKYRPERMSLAELFEEAHGLAMRPHVLYQALVPIVAGPSLPNEHEECWLSSTETASWLRHWYPDLQPPRQSGGLLLDIRARDIFSAQSQAQEWLDRLSSRFRVGTRKRLEFHPELYLLGEPEPLVYARGPRRVEVLSLERTAEIFRLRLTPQIDAALELLEPLDHGPSAAAISGSWAALESLLVGPGDTSNRVVAATRMARIVACSYVRAEFTSLANAYATNRADNFANDLRAMDENREKALAFEKALRSGASIRFRSSRQNAALSRMRELLASPPEILPRIVRQIEDAFRRLYRQRNLIVHAGNTSSIAIDGTLRTVAPLVGAGIDRIVHASASQRIDPLLLAATAEIGLGRVQYSSAYNLVELLD